MLVAAANSNDVPLEYVSFALQLVETQSRLDPAYRKTMAMARTIASSLHAFVSKHSTFEEVDRVIRNTLAGLPLVRELAQNEEDEVAAKVREWCLSHGIESEALTISSKANDTTLTPLSSTTSLLPLLLLNVQFIAQHATMPRLRHAASGAAILFVVVLACWWWK